MTFWERLKNNRKKPSIKFSVILLIFVIYLVFSYFWSVKSEVYAFDLLPPETNFYYEWPDKDTFDLELSQNVPFLELSAPNSHLNDIKVLLGNRFIDVEEIVWFQVKQNDEDYYLIRLRSLSDKFIENLQNSQSKYKLRKARDGVLFVYTQEDLLLPDLVDGRFSVNHIKKGNNIYWQIEDSPDFLVDFSDNIKPFVKYQDTYLNIESNSLNLFQIYNESSVLDNRFSDILFPQDFDILLGLRASSTESMVNYISNQVILANFNNLPYFNLTQDKFNDYFLSDSVLWQRADDWLLIKQDDWWPLITDLASSLQLEEKKSLLPDGTAYVELVVKENQLTQHFKYMGHELWQIDDIFGTNIDRNFYISNNRNVLENLISQNVNLHTFSQVCAPAGDYSVLDILWWDNNKLKNSALKDYFISKNIPNLHIFTYQNSVIRGINWCF